jgi:hypothetical protein
MDLRATLKDYSPKGFLYAVNNSSGIRNSISDRSDVCGAVLWNRGQLSRCQDCGDNCDDRLLAVRIHNGTISLSRFIFAIAEAAEQASGTRLTDAQDPARFTLSGAPESSTGHSCSNAMTQLLGRNDTALSRAVSSAHPKGCQVKERHERDQLQSPRFTPTNAGRDVLP